MAPVLKREAAKRDLISNGCGMPETADIEVADRFFERSPKAERLFSCERRNFRACADSRYPMASRRFFCFYFPLEDGVDLIRVVHGNRDLKRLLAEGFSADQAGSRPSVKAWFGPLELFVFSFASYTFGYCEYTV